MPNSADSVAALGARRWASTASRAARSRRFVRSAAALLVNAVSAASRSSAAGRSGVAGRRARRRPSPPRAGRRRRRAHAAVACSGGPGRGPARRAGPAPWPLRTTEASRNACSWFGEVRRGRRSPLEGRFEAGAAVQLAGRAAERFPAVGGGGEVAQDALPGGVLVEPRPQPWPRPGEGFVGQLDGVLLGGHQPCTDQQAEDVVAVASPPSARAGTRERTGSPSDDGETSRSIIERSLGRCSAGRLSYSRSAERATAPRISPVARYPSTVNTRPSRRCHVSAKACDSNGSAPGSPSQSRTNRSTNPASRRSPAASAGPSIAWRSDSPASGLTRCRPRSARRGEVVVDGEGGDVVGTHGDHHRRRLGGVAGEPGTQRPRPLGAGVVEGEQLLELVDDQHRAGLPPTRRGRWSSPPAGRLPGTNTTTRVSRPLAVPGSARRARATTCRNPTGR